MLEEVCVICQRLLTVNHEILPAKLNFNGVQ